MEARQEMPRGDSYTSNSLNKSPTPSSVGQGSRKAADVEGSQGGHTGKPSTTLSRPGSGCDSCLSWLPFR